MAQPPPRAGSVEQLKRAAASSQACELWRDATQTVFGEGEEHAMGPDFRVSRQRGEVLASPFGIPVVATVHEGCRRRVP